MNRSTISTHDAPAAIGPYSQGIIARGKMLFTAGQIPIDPTTSELVQGGITEQTHRVLRNMRAILRAAECTMHDVVKVTIYMKNMQDYGIVNAIYSEYFSDEAPARTAMEVNRLPKDVLISMECIAVVSGILMRLFLLLMSLSMLPVIGVSQPKVADADTVDVMKRAKVAMYKSMIQPGWGQWQNHKHIKALVFLGTEITLVAAIYNQHMQWERYKEKRSDAQRIYEQSLLAEDEFWVNEYSRRGDFYVKDRNKLLWWLLWFEIFNVTDAYVDAALADFDVSSDLTALPTPDLTGFALRLQLNF